MRNQSRIDNYLITLGDQLQKSLGSLRSAKDASEAYDVFNNSFLEVTIKFAPIKTVNLSKNPMPKWFDNSLKTFRTKRYNAYKLWNSNREYSNNLNRF